MALLFHRLAAKEARDAEAWYSARSTRAAQRFRQEVAAAAERIVADPEAHPFVIGPFRQSRVRGFPFTLIFRGLDSANVLIVAVAHTSRRPGYWRQRK